MIPWFLVNLPGCTTITFSSIRTFPSPQKYPSYPFIVHPYSHLQPQATTNLLSDSISLPFLDTLYKWNHTICSLCAWILSLCIMFLRIIYIVEYIGVYISNNIYVFTYISIYISMSMYIYIDVACVCVCVCVCITSSSSIHPLIDS